jgi:hypothetical protein
MKLLTEQRLIDLAEKAEADESEDWNQYLYVRYVGESNSHFFFDSKQRIAITGFDDVDVITLHVGHWDGDDWVDFSYAEEIVMIPSDWEEISSEVAQ